MIKRLLILLLLLPLLLAACSGTESNACIAEPPESQAEMPEGSDTQEDVSSSKEVTLDPTATSAPKEEFTYDGPQMECTLVSSQPEATSELVALLSVKENDWVSGPETAAVTFVEYSDFQ